MHELGLASDVLRVCETSLAAHGQGRIAQVRLAVGELSAVEPDLLRFAWEAVTSDGPHAGAKLEVEWRYARQICTQCQAAKPRATGSWLRLCPDCGHALRVEGGDELDVIDLQIDLQTDSAAPAVASGEEDVEDS